MDLTETITCTKINEVYMRIDADGGVRQELSDFFSYYANNYKFHPKFKARVWDGKIRLYSPVKPFLYIGLLQQLKEFCDVREYKLIIDKNLQPEGGLIESDLLQLCSDIGFKLTPRDYQIEYVLNALNNDRSISLSPTSSGKSAIIYLIQQFYHQSFGHRTLIVVPTVSLVEQMAGDFIDYGCDPETIHKIYSGAEKNVQNPIVISTWQSLMNMPKTWFGQFRVILGDEAHGFAATSLIKIMESLSNAQFRHGFSGTIPKDAKANQMLLQGLFGQIKRVISTSDLIESKTVADFKVKALILKHSDETKKQFHAGLKQIAKEKRYHAEREFLNHSERRNIFIRNLVWSLKDQNNLILFDLVEKHGKILEPLLRRDDRQLHFIYGGVDGKERERVRKLVENDPLKQHDILASYGTLSTGYSLKRLDNIIFASGSKSEVKVLQSIGRVLRRGNGSDDATLYDIADDLAKGTSVNYTMKHFQQRVEFYNQEKFEYKIYTIDLK